MSQEFDNIVLDLVKQKWFYPYEYMSLENLKNNCLTKKSFMGVRGNKS